MQARPAPVLQQTCAEQALQRSAEVRLPGHSGGARMPEDVQAKMEAAFGMDFSPVRIHEGPHARAIRALAYTRGTDIHFAPGQYQPRSQRGQELLGHELTHVVQQSQGRVQATTQAKGVNINDDAGLEREADEMGARAARGELNGQSPEVEVGQTTRDAYRTSSTEGMRSQSHSPQTQMSGVVQLKAIREDYPWPGVIVKDTDTWVGPSPDSGKVGTLKTGTRVRVMNSLIDCYGIIPEDGTKKAYTLQDNVDDVPKLRTDYPWQGMAAKDASLYVGPSAASGLVKKVKKGTFVEVVNELLDYYGVIPKGDKNKGYTLQSNIEDPTASKMESMVGDSMRWEQSSASGTTDFAKAARDTSKSMPAVGPSTIMNCWEAILLAAYQIGVLDRAKIKTLYSSQSNLKGMMVKKRGTYKIGDKKNIPLRGEIIYMNGLAHVVLAAGEMDAQGKAVVYSFWPPSDFSPAVVRAKIAAGKINDVKKGKIQKATIEDLADWIIKMSLTPHPITFGSPAW